jgi:hypothetical protein
MFVCPSEWSITPASGGDFHEILYLSIFRNSGERIQVLFKSDKNNGYSAWRTVYNYVIFQ